MTKVEYLEKQREMAYHNLNCYSANASMTIAKEKFAIEYTQAKEECAVIEELILQENGRKEKPLIGVLVIDGKVSQAWEKVREGLDTLVKL